MSDMNQASALENIFLSTLQVLFGVLVTDVIGRNDE
jgi:hypothetical protein